MVEFITESPFTKRFQENQAASQARDLRNIRIEAGRSELDEHERNRRRRDEIDRVTRETILAQQQPTQTQQSAPSPVQNAGLSEIAPSPVQPDTQPQQGFRSRLAARLATVPGGGAAAAEMTIADLDQQQKIMERTFELATSNPDAAMAWAEQNGMPVPAGMQNLMRNTQVSQAISNGMKQINAIYGTSAAQAGRRFQAFQQLLKGIDEAAKQQGGLPAQTQQGVIQNLPTPTTAGLEAPATKEVFDPTTGRKVVMQWDGSKWVQLGGVEAEEGPNTQRGRDIAALLERGFSETDAQDIAAGRIRVTPPDNFGNVYLVNVATGERRPVGELKGPLSGQQPMNTSGNLEAEGGGQGLGAEVPEPPAQLSQAPQGPVPLQDVEMISIEEAARGGTGPWANLAAAVDGVIGGLLDTNSLFPDVAENRQHLRTLNQVAKTVLVNNPRFPVAEQQIVQQLLPDPDTFFANPQTEARNLANLRQILATVYEQNLASIQSGAVTQKAAGELANKNAEIARVLALMGDPPTPVQTEPQDGAGQTEKSPFPEHPDARRAPDGNWYVQRNGQYFRVDP